MKTSVPVFAALGDETRLFLVIRLSTGKPMSIASLTCGTRITRQAVTRHLHVLRDAGLVKGSKRGREQLWSLNPRQLAEAQRQLALISRQWDQALDRLRAMVELPE